ncbi:bifunctional 3-deoxy-7-phosphoheptulonate synthase/chorismate mutase [Salinicoccus sp. HZC-1]|uniref:bifunctional 3-deoxy-7-phosphoheptulonate synthase/chorismate mutase n=1 Tax=Salinicoccus sp. HZC-1 TaxID=3385497 RepID=UPI00398A9920
MTDNHRDELKEIDEKLLELLELRAQKAGRVETKIDEQNYILNIVSNYSGMYSKDFVLKLFKALFRETTETPGHEEGREMLVSRKQKKSDTIVNVGSLEIGGSEPVNIFGPCAVESYEQAAEVASNLNGKGLGIIRGGAFKPRTSPYDFQGLGVEGLKILSQIREGYNLAVISEITTPGHVELAEPYLDVFQIGARNMQNFELLKAAGKSRKPILLKRGLSATLEEFLYAAEYILAEGNPNVVLCERGIRTYEKSTRNTLDISAVPLLKQASHLPVMVDVTHSTGRKEIMLECARAALAAGADGIMAEVHPEPVMALSDSGQQMSLDEFDKFYTNLV